MTTPRDSLHDRLDDLHRQLEQAEHLDDADRRLLQQVMDDIQRLLDQERPEAQHYGGLAERLEGAAVSVERSNPTLADGINRLAQILANMGI